MLRIHVCFSAICFSTIGLFASVGFSQDFYQPAVTYSQPYTSQTYISQPYSVQYMPSQLLGTEVVGTPVANYSSSFEVPAQTYSGTQGIVLQDNVTFQEQAMPPLISPDYGYAGPGDMRTHLWNDHSSDLKANGVSQDQLMSMSMAKVQKWHNFFHGSEGRPQQ